MADLLFTNYGELKASLADYMYGRKDLAARIPGFVMLAERRIFRRLRVRQNQLTDTGTTTGTITLPEGYIETKLLTVGGYPLERVTDMELESLQITLPETNARQRAYQRVGATLELWPPPGEATAYIHQYFRSYAGTLSAEDDTNPILTEFPELYLYGSMMEYMPFAAKDQRLPAFGQLFTEAMDAALQEYGEQETTGSPLDVTSAYGD
jgi:hypothetical protein